jgi:hypothetical protein
MPEPALSVKDGLDLGSIDLRAWWGCRVAADPATTASKSQATGSISFQAFCQEPPCVFR